MRAVSMAPPRAPAGPAPPMNRMPDRRRLAGFAAAFAMVCVWASWIPMTRLAVTVCLPPEDDAALHFGVSGPLLAPFLALRRRKVP